ncbi:hypothetical protein LMG27177_01098 [Paraburkholderia fynbosensis]|uniref:Lauroyl/myristoyl acyltransferase n=2 Tax=Paraburkholderia fynbosensis TaxID=1200993 RepID=A0A6J5FMK6_9BURK|nr:hypothetical protein LMG27177_01098 [Paraburkholderia fynbosensis]
MGWWSAAPVRMTSLRNEIARARRRLQGWSIAHMPPSVIEPLAAAVWKAHSLVDARARWNGISRCESGRDMPGSAPFSATQVSSGSLRESLIDKRIYYGRLLRGREDWPDLQHVAQMLAARIRQLQAEVPGRPVIVSPFHYVSQYANIYVIDALREMLGLESISVVSGVPRDMYGDDQTLIPSVTVLYTYGDDNRNGLGLRVARTLRRNGVAVLFADVPPFALHRYPMETVGVSIFGRNARIHNGVFRLGAPFNAMLLPFYLRFRQGRFSAELFGPLPLAAPDAPQWLAGYIESAALDNYPDWLVSGHPSMYAFAPVR